MQDLEKIETGILLTMLAAYTSYFERTLTVTEAEDCTITIGKLKKEIALRKKVAELL